MLLLSARGREDSNQVILSSVTSLYIFVTTYPIPKHINYTEEPDQDSDDIDGDESDSDSSGRTVVTDDVVDTTTVVHRSSEQHAEACVENVTAGQDTSRCTIRSRILATGSTLK